MTVSIRWLASGTVVFCADLLISFTVYHWSRNLAIANIFSILISSIFGYTLNGKVVFKQDYRLQQAITYVTSVIFSLVFNTWSMLILVEEFNLHFLPSKIFVTALMLPMNFAVAKRIFKTPKQGVVG